MVQTKMILERELLKAIGETLEMMTLSLSLAVVFGTLLGLVLYLTAHPLFFRHKIINSLSGALVNMIRSIPFVILMVLCMPFTQLVVGTTIGPKAAVVPLTIASIAFLARLIEGALEEVDLGVIEAAFATGAKVHLILRRVVFVEATPGIVRAITVTFVSLIGYSAMAGLVGGGGIGNLAIQYGYYRYETGVMIVTVALLIGFVQLGQGIGDQIARCLNKR